MDLPIKNVEDLRSEIARLEVIAKQQNGALGARLNSPWAVLSAIISLFPKSTATNNFKSNFANQDIVGLLSRIVLPFTLNKTVFRNSGFLIKTLVGLVSQKASHFISEDSVGGLWDKAKSLFAKNSGSKNDKAQPKDLKGFGVPQA
jgi:hypothetical protein